MKGEGWKVNDGSEGCRVNYFPFFPIFSSWVKIRLHTKNHLPKLPGTVWTPLLGGRGGQLIQKKITYFF